MTESGPPRPRTSVEPSSNDASDAVGTDLNDDNLFQHRHAPIAERGNLAAGRTTFERRHQAEGAPGATHVQADDDAGTGLPTFKDQVDECPVERNSAKEIARKQQQRLHQKFPTGVARVETKMGGLPTFKDQVDERNYEPRGGNNTKFQNTDGSGNFDNGGWDVDDKSDPSPGAARIQMNKRLPTYKDQVNDDRTGSERRPNPAHLQRIIRDGGGLLPNYKDQVNDRNAPRAASNNARGRQDNNDHVNNVKAPLDEEVALPNEHMIKAELVKDDIPVAQVVAERRRLKQNICIVLVVTNLILFSVLIFGGTCVFGGNCVFSSEEESSMVQNQNFTCAVDIDISCRTSNDTICSELIPPPETMSCFSNTTAIRFQYRNAVCDSGGSSDDTGTSSDCVDVAPLVVSQSTEIRCNENDESGKALLVEPKFVEKYDTFIVSTTGSNKELPGKMVCQLMGEDDMILQRLEIVLSGNFPLRAGDQFGAFRVEQCSTAVCQDWFTYTLTIKNTNQNPVLLSAFEFTPPNGIPVDLLTEITPGQLEAGKVMDVTRLVEVDTCLNFEYLAWAFVDFSLENGDKCRGGDDFSPTPPPSPSPTYEPTPASTDDNEDCSITIDVECRTDDGSDCSNLEDSFASCGTDFSLLRFQYNPGFSCDPVGHNQGNSASCQDLDFLLDESIVIFCETPEGDAMRVEPIYLPRWNREFTVEPKGRRRLFPQYITCSLITTSGVIMQRNTIDTSGTVDVSRSDRFGAMEVLGCTGDPSCAEALFYDIKIRNDGESPFLLGDFELELNDQEYGLSSLDPEAFDLLPVNQTVHIQRALELDTCLGESAAVSIYANANTPLGEGYCYTRVNFNPDDPGPAECEVDAFVKCTFSNGRPCHEIEHREGSCASSQELIALQFRYRDIDCGGRALPGHCTDLAPLTEDVKVRCTAETGTQLVVEPSEIERYDTFKVSMKNGDILNGRIDCVFIGLGGNLLQRNVIDVTRFQEFEDGTRSGGMELMACSDTSCRELVSFNVTVRNDGSQPVAVTELELENKVSSLGNDLPDSFLPYLAKRSLGLGESTSVVVGLERDVCFGSLRFHADAEVTAKTMSGETCDNDRSRGSGGSNSGSLDPPPLLPTGTSSPTSSPPIEEEEDSLSSEAIFGLVAAGIAFELLICVGLYVYYYQRWKILRRNKTDGTAATKTIVTTTTRTENS